MESAVVMALLQAMYLLYNRCDDDEGIVSCCEALWGDLQRERGVFTCD